MHSTPFEKHILSMSVLMTPDKANFSGNVHGGDLLKYLDQVAYACASRYCGHYVVTLSVDQVLFKHAIPVGTLVTFLASVNYTGKTSMEVGMKVVSKDIEKWIATHTNSCILTMIAVGGVEKPRLVPPLGHQNVVEKRRFHDGKMRRELRLHGYNMLKAPTQ